MPPCLARPGFSLTEILIVIALIVLLLALAIPAFNFITGSRSVDGAANQISAFLGRARAEAIGLQEARGVMFFIEPSNQRVTLALVKQATAPIGPSPVPPTTDYWHDINNDGSDDIDIYLDLASDADFLTLPAGVSMQLLSDGLTNPTTGFRASDGYIGFNKIAATGTSNTALGQAPEPRLRCSGVILFDGNGRLVSKAYALRTRQPNGAAFTPTDMGTFLYKNTTTLPEAVADFVPWGPALNAAAPNGPLRSQFGFVLFDSDTFHNRFGSNADADPRLDQNVTAYGTSGTSPEAQEESWLDQNASPVLINRYNGTLVRGE